MFLLCLGASILCSCKNHKLYRQLEEFVGQQIVLPIIPQVDSSRMGSVNYLDKSILMVVYVDSIECTTCRAKGMFRYGDAIDLSRDSLPEFALLFIYSPKKQHLKDIQLALELSGFDYPILMDVDGAFPRKNPHIPQDNRFHTFLLNKEREVVLVGDPSNNPTLWGLYKSTIYSLANN